MALPPGFTPIKDAPLFKGRRVSLMGIITKIQAPYKTKGDDWVLDFHMQDENFTMTSGYNPSEIRCKFFRRDASKFLAGYTGDLVLIREIEVKGFSSKTEVVSSSRDPAEMLIFPYDKVPHPALSEPFGRGTQTLSYEPNHTARPPTAVEQLAIINLRASAAPRTATLNVGQQQAALPSRDRKALIQDVQMSNFYDLTVEVVKIWHEGFGDVDLYVTDYTSNPALFFYEDPALVKEDGFSSQVLNKWPGPYGQLTMQVRLFEPHASYAREKVRVGDVVSLRNVHVKLAPNNKLEGALHEDRQNPDKRDIMILNYEKDYTELVIRKQAYVAKTRKVREQHAYDRLHPGDPKKPSARTSAKKKEERRARKLQKRRQDQVELEKTAEENRITRAGVNTNIRASHPQIQLSTVEEILHNPRCRKETPGGGHIDLPFVNDRYRAQLRVVDFRPHNLEDFCRSMADPRWNRALQEPGDTNRRRDDRWKWAFLLTLEAGGAKAGTTPEYLHVVVNNEAGQYLLNMDATDLRNDSSGRTVKKLEEKLFILWGNLLELKRELALKGPDSTDTLPLPCGDSRLQNKPFECCISEYSFKRPGSDSAAWPHGYERRYMLDSTTIMGVE